MPLASLQIPVVVSDSFLVPPAPLAVALLGTTSCLQIYKSQVVLLQATSHNRVELPLEEHNSLLYTLHTIDRLCNTR